DSAKRVGSAEDRPHVLAEGTRAAAAIRNSDRCVLFQFLSGRFVQLSVRLDVDDVSRLGPLSRTDGSVLVAAAIVCGGDMESRDDGVSDPGARSGRAFEGGALAAAGGETA